MEMTQGKLHSKVVKTSCGQCYVGCGINVTLEGGVVVNIEGNPDSPQNRGMMCAKGKAGFMNLYNPNRIKVPMKRTNPKKGMHEDPGFVEISWKEAIDTIVAQLERIRDNPKKFWIHAWDFVGDGAIWFTALANAFGSNQVLAAGSPTCGKVVHPVEYFSGGGFHQAPDMHYANYCILIGTQVGFAARGSFVHHLTDMADARARGMKVVVVDPVCAQAGSKADEWIPIRPGTDGALALSMLHVLLNELGIYDEPHLKKRTNAPYLVGPDGRYVRDPETNEPQIYDLADGKVKVHNDPGLKDPAIKGTYDVQGKQARTAFDLLREHVATHPPEATEKYTTIPAATARRLATEFGKAVRVGETITIDGVELPYRPAVVDWAKGPQGHKHGFHNCWPLKMLNIVVGSVNVPGGILSTGAAGDHPHKWWPESGIDGMLEHGGQLMPTPHPSAFPGRTPMPVSRADLGEIFPLAAHFHTNLPATTDDFSSFGLTENDRIEVLLHTPINSLFSSFGDHKKVERLYQSFRFMVGFAVEVNETTLFDDVVLPFPSYLERYDFGSGTGAFLLGPCGQDDFYWQVRHPVVEPPPGVRHPQDVFQEIAQRLGILNDLYRMLNHTYRLDGKHALKSTKPYPIAEIIDMQTRKWFGDDHGLEWFKEHGVYRHPRSVREAYIGPYVDGRMPVYLEHFVDKGVEMKAALDKMGLKWDLSDYNPLPGFMPCPSYHAIQKGDYDLIAVHFKYAYVYGAYGNENPWIDELCEETGAYRIMLNSAVGKAKGIVDGDAVWLESPVQKVRAIVRLTNCVHPEVVGVGGHFGHFAPGMPFAKGKGVNMNGLCPNTLDRIDSISNALDHCVEVKVYK
ncbi:MAG: molybdopterin-dependent oxidoreductase [Betaproteobacteria bacterium]|nr:molybdopterin-dependent oxidoreductase [Betaproteobacteria bacterium]